ncbi:hypothetical protein COCON_G00023850 [Conger conger]|uniref:Structure-specific endonuclease subunit SLX4 n=1 Tax=Conger conger TaxID=82655 RepID=A0A9Q1DXG0_CONCO|nr:hypothetical protein COCON_G00023850 [Conger conger]
MDDSDLDFTDLCSKLLKRVRKKEKGDSGDERRKDASQNLTQNTEPAPSQSKDSTKRRKAKQDAELATWKQLDCRSAGASQFNSSAGEGSTGQPCISVAVPQTSSSQAAVEPGAAGLSLGARQNGHVNLRAKDKVVSRMQQFRWVSPQKMTHVENDHPERIALDAEDRTAQSAAPQAVDLLQGPLGDEALALRLQEELDQEARCPGEPVDLEQGGLFFCQICQRDLSALSPLRRTQHINRCLDESEGSGPAAPAPPAVPECPICGKMFKSQKSRASHLKRCSTEMGVAPALLLQALQRQATDTASDSAANQPPPAGEREGDREALLAPPAADTLSLQWRAEAGKRRGQKKGRPHPRPLSSWSRSRARPSGVCRTGSRPSCSTPAPPPDSSPACLHPAGLEWHCPPVAEEKVAPPTQAVVFAPAEPPLPAPSTPGVGSQTLGDLMDLAEEGLTLTQWGYTPKPDCAPTLDPTEDIDPGVADLQLSGFLPERPHTASASSNTGALSRLTADLSTMVNNPQLSDVQLQVDSGEVFFAHSFMLYARCPLLVRMVHDSGFGVEEEGMPSAQRVLLGDVSPEAVRVLLQYLYCARCPLTPSLLPHLQDLALRLGLGELLQACQSYSGGAAVRQWAESREPERREEEQEEEEECGQHKFLELLRSMWEEEEAEEGGGGDGEEVEGGAEGRVREEELQEIYEFAATQRKTVIEEEEENAAMETEEEEEEERKNAAM